LRDPAAEKRPEADLDANLVWRASVGDRSAEEALYRRHVQYVHGLLCRLLGNQTDAEDAVQETFVIALDRLGQLRDAEAFRGWLAQIAVSRARRLFRKQKLLRFLGLNGNRDEETIACVVGPYASASVRVEMATLHQLLERLPADQRLAWSLRHVEGESLEEVAMHCDCSLATAKRRVAAAHTAIEAGLGNSMEAA
jgi:RNA polymerase sigma-70 factor (ECF subfamily)